MSRLTRKNLATLTMRQSPAPNFDTQSYTTATLSDSDTPRSVDTSYTEEIKEQTMLQKRQMAATKKRDDDTQSVASSSVSSLHFNELTHITDIEQLHTYHQTKLREIMKSNDLLKKQIKQLKKENQDNYRVKMIKNLRQQLREQQTICEALTNKLLNTGIAEKELNMLYDEVLSHCKLARPNATSQLKKDVSSITQTQHIFFCV